MWCGAYKCKRANRSKPCSHVALVCDRFGIEPKFVSKSAKKPTQLPADKIRLAPTIRQRPVPFPLTPKFMDPDLVRLFQSDYDLPTSAPTELKPTTLPALCLCGLPYDTKDIQLRPTPIRLLYQLGPVPNPVKFWVAKCKNAKPDCDVYADGAGHLIWICTPELGIAEAMFYDALLSVSFERLRCCGYLLLCAAIRDEVLGVFLVQRSTSATQAAKQGARRCVYLLQHLQQVLSVLARPRENAC